MSLGIIKNDDDYLIEREEKNMDLDNDELKATRKMNGADKEIQDGEYVRLDDGIIGKYTTNKNYWNVVKTNNKEIGFDIENDVIKHSKNITDLIEIGDYVNGHLVFDKILDAIYIEDNQNKMAHIPITNKDIKSIVTKEQFNSIAYRLEE